MPSLKDLRLRIKSIKSTQKITSAMKMVAAAKLRRSQEKVLHARPYAQGLNLLAVNALSQLPDLPMKPSLLLTGRPDNPVHLIVVATSDRGLCGGFNVNIVREAKAMIRELQAEGTPVKIFCIGRKGYDLLKRDYANLMLDTVKDVGKKGVQYTEALEIGQQLQQLLENNVCGRISVVYSLFKTVLSQVITRKQVIPLELPATQVSDLYEYEPTQAAFVEELLPKNFAIQLYQILMETCASEHGARMTAMDNATRNAKDVIKRLELTYNRTRQAQITKELIEIISGAEAL